MLVKITMSVFIKTLEKIVEAIILTLANAPKDSDIRPALLLIVEGQQKISEAIKILKKG